MVTKKQAKEFAEKSLPQVSGFHNEVLELMKQFANHCIEEYMESGFKMTDLMLEIAKTEGVWYTSASIINENFIDVYIRTGSGENFIKDVSIRIHEKLLQYGTNYKD